MSQASSDQRELEQRRRRGPSLGTYLELTKARLSAMVLLSALAAFLIAGRGQLDGFLLAGTLLGTGLCALSANAFNQILERKRDARMERTKDRPLPAGAMSSAHALAVASGLGLLGLAILLAMVNGLAAGLALFTIALYVLVYTPLKTRSPVNTLVGAVCGAIPPLIGWAGAVNRLDGGAWLLAALLFLWQVPHFLALAWLYREDYARGGFRMLPAVDPSGRLTGVLAADYSLALLPLGIAFSLAKVAGPIFLFGYFVLGIGLLLLSVNLWRQLTPRSARSLFLASVIYLPLALALLLIDPGEPQAPTRVAYEQNATEAPPLTVPASRDTGSPARQP